MQITFRTTSRPPRSIPKAYGQLPRSDARLAIPYDEMEDDIPVIFLSHRWFRPWRSQEECEQNGHTWAGEPHPDDEMRTKYHLTVSGIELLARQRNWELSRLGVWMDYACIEQDDLRLRSAGVRSLIGYMCRCSLVMIPTSTKPDFPTVHRMPSEYGERAWTRLEALGCYVQGLLNDQKPELYFSAPGDRPPWGSCLQGFFGGPRSHCPPQLREDSAPPHLRAPTSVEVRRHLGRRTHCEVALRKLLA